MRAFEDCQNGRGPGFWIGHILPRQPNIREVVEILLGIAVMINHHTSEAVNAKKEETALPAKGVIPKPPQ